MSGQHSRPVRATAGARLAAAIAAEKLDEFGNPVQPSHRRPAQPRVPVKRKRAIIDDDETDADDKNFAVVSSTEDGSDDNNDIMEISNEEVRI